jgi:UDP-3-O-[3-hydroxymyristoyl] glucosamine N-acyltransferase
MTYKLSQLAAHVGGQLAFGPDREIAGLCSITETGDQASSHLSYLLPQRSFAEIQKSQVQSFLVAQLPAELEERDALAGRSLVTVANPELAFAQLLAFFHPQPRVEAHDIHPTAVVAEDVVFEGPVRVGPFCTLEAGVRCGGGTSIGAHSYIGKGTRLGADCRIMASCTIYHDCELGDRVTIHSGTTVGADGFGYANDKGRWTKIPHVGRVVIHDDVEIGANACIDRGALQDTVIGKGSKLDDLVMIAHNCKIGEHVVIAGCSGMAGSTEIGDRCQIGGRVGFSGHIKVAADSAFAAMSGVFRSVPAPGFYSGTPAIQHSLRNRIYIEEQRLPEYRKRIQQLEERLEHLQEDKAKGDD